MSRSDKLLSLSEIADLANVTPAAVSNWRHRHQDFPRPVLIDLQDRFSVLDVARWLDHRKIARPALDTDETVGTSYGQRFRRRAGMAQTARGHPGRDRGESMSIESNKTLWRLFDQYRGTVKASSLAELVLALVYLRERSPKEWASLINRPHVDRPMVEENLRVAAPGVDWPQYLRVGSGDAIANRVELAPFVVAIDEMGTAAEFENLLSANMFDELLESLAAAQGRSGNVYTPKTIAGLVVELLEPRATDRIFDPCCRTGQFLVAAAQAVQRRAGSVAGLSVAGLDYSERSCQIARMNLELWGVDADVRPGSADTLAAGAIEDVYDLVITNPPFNLKSWHGQVDRGRWRYAPPPAHNANFGWLQFVISALAPNGRAAVLMPNGAGISANSAEREIRQAMVEDGAVQAMIALPGNLFASTPVPATMWLLQRPSGVANEEVLFIDATSMGEATGRSLRNLRSEDIDTIVRAHKVWRQRLGTLPAFASAVDIETIRHAEYRLNPREYVRSSAEPADETNEMQAVRVLLSELQRLQEHAERGDVRIDRGLRRLGL